MDVCAVCAWRATCQKKFSVSGKDMRCPDFAKDVTIKEKQKKIRKQNRRPVEAERSRKTGDIRQVFRIQGRAVRSNT